MYIPNFGNINKPTPKDNAKKLKGVHSHLKFVKCPGCGQETCYWIGGAPHDIECINVYCKFYAVPIGEGEKRIHFGEGYGCDKPYNESEPKKVVSDEEAPEFDLDDFEFEGPFGD